MKTVEVGVAQGGVEADMFTESTMDNFWTLNFLEKYMVGHKGFICGGCFKNIFNREKIKDIDIFFKSMNDFNEAVNYYENLINEEISDEWRYYYRNENVISYMHTRTGTRIELCRTIFGEPEEIISNFDFTITKFAYFKKEVPDDESVDQENPDTHIEYRVMHHDKFFEHLHLKRLVTDDKIPFPMGTFERMIRYVEYGYFPCRETKVKIAKALTKLSEEQIQVSENLYKGWD